MIGAFCCFKSLHPDDLLIRYICLYIRHNCIFLCALISARCMCFTKFKITTYQFANSHVNITAYIFHISKHEALIGKTYFVSLDTASKILIHISSKVLPTCSLNFCMSFILLWSNLPSLKNVFCLY